MKTNWYVGQQVYCLVYGEGVVDDVFESSGEYPILAKFSNNALCRYTNDGRMFKGRNVCLYHSKPEIIVPKWQPKEGEWCWFWDEEGNNGVRLAKFLKITDNNNYTANGGSIWQNCAPFIGELPEHLKEVLK
jgi:hypothetical protein